VKVFKRLKTMKGPADKYEKIVYWSDEDNCFIGVCPDLFAGGVHGDDPMAVFTELLEVVDEWVKIFETDGRPWPEAKQRALQAV
jgi:predicted RNase H-like HicB family nuclease